MSGDSSLGIGIGLALKSYGRAVSYVKIGRVLDLTTPFSELTFTLADKSGEGNDATLYSGRYISTDGSTDRGIVADCSAAGAGNYYLTGKVRPNAVTTAELTMDGSTDSGLTGLTADVWQTFTTATSAVTPSAVQVGYDGSTASAADWSDVRLIDSSDGSTVARWQLNESADGDLNGYPALDSVGGYHGTHTGCAGGTGETTILQTAGMDWNKRMWFDGGQEVLFTQSSVIGTNDFVVRFRLSSVASNSSGRIVQVGSGTGVVSNNGYFISLAGNGSLVAGVDGLFGNIASSGVTAGDYVITFDRSGNATATKDGVSFGSGLDISSKSAVSLTATNGVIGNRDHTTDFYLSDAILSDISLDLNADSTIQQAFSGYGNTDDKWVDTVGSNNGTVVGSPSNFLIPASDATPTNDALGNAIADPRVNIKVVNIFDTETVDLPDNASLETVRSVTLAVYNDGGTKDVLQASGGASFVDIAANTLQTDQTGTHTYYVNGSATTTLAAGWNIVTIVFDAGKDLSGGKITAISGSLLAYDPTALTADQATQNYNAFKSQYGL